MIGGANLLTFAQQPWFLAFVAGAVMIAIFARRRLQMITSGLSSDYAAILTVTDASLLVGRRQYNQAYILYLTTLLLIYLVLCLCQPIAGYLAKSVGDETIADLWATPAGPFAISSFIVAVGPNAAWFEKLETAIRRLAHRLAGIPEDLYELLNVIKRFDFFDPKLGRSISPEALEMGSESEIATTVIGFDMAEARALKRNVVTTMVFYSWIIAEAGRSIWSEQTRSRFAHQVEQLRKEMKRFRNNFEILMKDTRHLRFFVEAAPLLEQPAGMPPNDDVKARLAKSREANEAEVALFRVRWEEIAEQAAALAAGYRVVFALYTVNDKNPTYDGNEQVALSAMLAEIWRPRFNRTVNLVLLSASVGFVGSFAGVALWKIGRYLARGDTLPVVQALEDSITFGVNNSIGTLFTLVLPILLIVLIRFYQKGDRRWIPLARRDSDNAGFPFLQVIKIVIYSVTASAVFSSSWFLMNQMISNSPNFGESIQGFFGAGWVNKTLVSGSGGIVACLVCYVLDRLEAGTLTFRPRVLVPPLGAALVACYVAIIQLYSPPSLSYWVVSKLSPYKGAPYDLFVQDILVYAAFAGAFLAMLTLTARR